MKKIIVSILVIVMIVTALAAMTGCTTLSIDEGLEYLKTCYANSIGEWSDIYLYKEKIYDKATDERDGQIINTKVNVNCMIDDKYNYHKDTDYAIDIYEEKFTEKSAGNGRLEQQKVGNNSIIAGKSGDKDALFVRKEVQESANKSLVNKYCQEGINAKDFYKSEYYSQYLIENKISEIANLNKDNMNFDIKGGGIVRKSKVVEYTFKVSDEYLREFKEMNGYDSIFAGKYVWIETSYDRISAIYTYEEEKLGGFLNVDYEKYSLMISYLGPIVSVPEYPTADEKEPEYEIINMFDGQNFTENVLLPLR